MTKKNEPVVVAPEDQALAVSMEFSGPANPEAERLARRLEAAEALIQAQSDLLDCYTLRKNRNRAMEAVFNARNEWVKAVNE